MSEEKKEEKFEASIRLQIAKDYMRVMDYWPDPVSLLTILGAIDDAFEARSRQIATLNSRIKRKETSKDEDKTLAS